MKKRLFSVLAIILLSVLPVTMSSVTGCTAQEGGKMIIPSGYGKYLYLFNDKSSASTQLPPAASGVFVSIHD